FFLNKWEKYLLSYSDVWAYCLMPNHFHFLLEIKDKTFFPKRINENRFLENQFKRLFSSYTLSFNKVYERRGSLFQKSFKRVKIDSERYLKHLIHYIHHNPIHHNFTEDYTDWKYSSYASITGSKPTKLKRKKMLELFNGKESFTTYHDEMKNYNKISHLLIE